MDILLALIGVLGCTVAIITLIIKLLFKKGWSLKKSVLIFVASFVVLIIGGTLGVNSTESSMNDITSEDLQGFANGEEKEKLIEYIHYFQNSSDSSKEPFVKEAVQLIVENNLTEQMKELEEIFFTEDDNNTNYIKEVIIDAFLNNGVTFSAHEKLIDIYLNSTNRELEDKLVAMLQNYNKEDTISYFGNNIKALYDENNLDKAKSAITMFNHLSIVDETKLTGLSDQMDSLVLQKEELDELAHQITSVEESISSISPSLPDGEIFNLHAFIVHQHEEGLYEIAYTEYDDFLGEIPSEQHALLETTWTQFQSKGLFDMYVVEVGEEEVQLTEDAGAFTQTWTVYQEVDPSELDNIDKVNELNWERDSLLVQLEDRQIGYDQMLDELHNSLQALASGAESASASAAPQTEVEGGDPMSLLAKGEINGIEFPLGTPQSEIINKWGAPESESSVGGGPELMYDNVYYYIDWSTDLLSGISVGDQTRNIYGIHVGMTREEIMDILGSPSYDGENEMEGGWTMTYTSGDHALYIDFNSETSPSYAIHLR